jgi:hypothetical protein
MMTTDEMRDYMRKRRGNNTPSPKTLMKVIQMRVCLYWAAGKLSEGQAAYLLGTDRVSARGLIKEILGEDWQSAKEPRA